MRVLRWSDDRSGSGLCFIGKAFRSMDDKHSDLGGTGGKAESGKGNHEYKFIFRFVVEYFKDNGEDYLWFDDAEWYYTADDILKLSQMPYDPKWCSEKIV